MRFGLYVSSTFSEADSKSGENEHPEKLSTGQERMPRVLAELLSKFGITNIKKSSSIIHCVCNGIRPVATVIISPTVQTVFKI